MENKKYEKKCLKIKPSEKCIVIAPHADDESIGCGGVLLKYNKNCKVVVLTDGSLCKNNAPQNIVNIRLEELRAAMNYAQISDFENLMIRDKEVNSNLNQIEKLNLSQYDYVFVPNQYDSHVDHYCILNKVKKILRFSSKTKIMCYEVSSPLSNPNVYLNISNLIDKKFELISLYKSQIKYKDYANAAIALNKYRSLVFGGQYAEVYFQLETTFIKKLLSQIYIANINNHKVFYFFGIKFKFRLKK